MSFVTDFFSNYFQNKPKKQIIQEVNKVDKTASLKEEDLSTLPTSRISVPDGYNPITGATGLTGFVNPEYDFEVVPLIRKLIRVNPDLGQALWDIVFLGNTEHRIKFNGDVKPEMVDKMRNHISEASKTWVEGCSGTSGISAKMFFQLIVAGATSAEWVVKNDLSGIKKTAFIKPESIRYKLNPITGLYEPYQKPPVYLANNTDLGYIKLNTRTFKYLSLYSDSELPYGIPPFIAALEPVVTQTILNDNIRKVARQTSLMGFLKILLAKPRIRDGQSKTSYKNELENNLDEAKNRVSGGLTDGIVVGYNEDVEEIEFQATTKTNSGIKDIYNLNEQQVFSGLKSDGALFGRDFGSSETQITVVLTKLISELYNMQVTVATMLEFGYKLELSLAGFDPKGLKVEFKKSTLLDDLKMTQAQELKIKNLHRLYYDGIISLEQYADEMGLEKADRKTPRHLWEVAAGEAGQAGVNKSNDATRKKKDREKGKSQSKKA